MKSNYAANIKSVETHPVEKSLKVEELYLKETYYCDFSNKGIVNAAKKFLGHKENTQKLVSEILLFVREKVIFGGDFWKTKASETLNKGYGACYNKNLLLVALLRYHGLPSKFCANPMSKYFNKAVMGLGYLPVSTPFYHCFTKVFIESEWINIDPTLDKNTYKTFFAPLDVDWQIDWDGCNDMLLYNKETIIGDPKIYDDIDSALDKNLNSHFLFKNEPDFLVSLWLHLGNLKLWKKTGRQPENRCIYS